LRRGVLAAVATAALLLVACDSSGSTVGASGSARANPSREPTTSGEPTPPATPAVPPPTAGSPSAACVHGWEAPARGTRAFAEPLTVIRRVTGVRGPLVVVDERYFTGPESPPSDMGYLLEVRRWYVKLYAKNDLSFQGRFLVEARQFGRGLSAVAPYDTSGWSSPDWRAFQYVSGDDRNRAIPGLPGTWSGVEYDFVKGGAGITIPGLPEQVVGCLSGT
jgi:hypothetical protein